MREAEELGSGAYERGRWAFRKGTCISLLLRCLAFRRHSTLSRHFKTCQFDKLIDVLPVQERAEYEEMKIDRKASEVRKLHRGMRKHGE